MSEIGGVPKTGQGFFSAAGDLKSKEQISKEASSSKTSAESDAAESANESSTTFSEKDISNALGKVKTRFLDQTNTAITQVNEAEDQIKQAQVLVRQQINTAKDLKQALGDGDTQKAVEAREALTTLQEKRDSLAASIESNNKNSAGTKSTNISLGNDQRASVNVRDVKLSKTPEADLSDKKGVDAFIDSLKEDKAELKTQRQELREVKKEISSVIKTGKEDLTKIQDRSIGNFQEAKSSTEKISADIVKNGAQALAASNINEAVAQVLLQ